MDILARSFTLSYTHRVFFSRHVAEADNPVIDSALGATRRTLVTIEEAVEAAHPGLARRLAARLGDRCAGDPLVLPGGEACKQDEAVYHAVVQAIHARGIDRHSAVLSCGGGAFLDATGYAAATAHRGVRLVRLPTTTLAQCDSGVGVKCGLNMFGKKNFTGAFHVPLAVVNDAALLESQPPDDQRAGLVEAVKVAIIKDAGFFAWLEDNLPRVASLERPALDQAVRRSAEWHFRHICEAGDPFETGSSRPLDFGHWAAHKLESLSGLALSHAHAVAIGIALDATYARLGGLLAPAAADRILAVLDGLGLPLSSPWLALPGPSGQPAVLAGLEEFREHLGGQLTVLMPTGIGTTVDVHAVDPGRVLQAIAFLQARAPGPADYQTRLSTASG